MILKRVVELDILEKDFIKPTSSFLFLFGQKQIGKTTLLQEYTKNKENFFFSCIEILPQLLFEKFAEQIVKYYSIKKEKIETFDAFLLFINTIEFRKKTVIVFDDFHLLSKIQKTCLDIFFIRWSSCLKDKNIQIIFATSVHSSLKEEIFVYKKASETIFLKSFKYEAIKTVLPTIKNEEQLKLFAIFGTNLHYLKQYNEQKSFEENLKDIFFHKNNQIAKDAMQYLKEELSETATYASILRAIAEGKCKIGEIAQALEVKSSYLTRYLQKLTDMMIISKTVPINEAFEKSKFGRYHIEDNFLKFWFKSLCFNTHLINANAINIFLNHIQKELKETLLPEAFKQHMTQAIEENFETFFEYTPLKLGSWWNNKEKQIDLIAYNDSYITFIEIKYKASQNVQQLHEELKTKSNHFETVLNKKFALFSSN
ncbi:MAG: DUF234 domain-containing protein [Arcobacteraceae bacterium]